MKSNQARKILKIAIFVYLASFLVINWNDVSWIFNYRAVYGLVSDFFNPYPSIDASTINAYFYPNHSTPQVNNATQQSQVALKTIKTSYTNKQNTLEIPKINVVVPVVFETSTQKTILMKDLENGVVYYPGSVYPGQIGQAVIIGHSAPPGWPHVKNDWAFTDLEKLVPGDEIYIDLNNQQYKYVVKTKTIIKRGAEVPSDQSATNTNVLTLVSCWPPGKDYQRIAVTAILSDN